MQDSKEPSDWGRMKYHIEKMTAIQQNLQECNLDSRQIKIDAKEEGFNPEIIMLLSQLRSNHPHDNAEKFLNLFVKYAQRLGVRFVNLPSDPDIDTEVSESTKRTPMIVSEDQYEPNRNPFSDKTKVILQLVLAICVTISFLWLLH